MPKLGRKKQTLQEKNSKKWIFLMNTDAKSHQQNIIKLKLRIHEKNISRIYLRKARLIKHLEIAQGIPSNILKEIVCIILLMHAEKLN
jgi:hypothetical protein